MNRPNRDVARRLLLDKLEAAYRKCNCSIPSTSELYGEVNDILDALGEFGLRPRGVMYDESRLSRCPDGCGNDCCVPGKSPYELDEDDSLGE